MKSSIATILFVFCFVTGCDSFEPAEALLTLKTPSYEPDVLIQAEAWVAVAAVSEGKAHEFPDTGFNVVFLEFGRIGGTASANQFGGHYAALPEGTFRVRDVVSTLIGEGSKRQRELAGILLLELGHAVSFETEGAVLQLRDKDGDGIRFQRSSGVETDNVLHPNTLPTTPPPLG